MTPREFVDGFAREKRSLLELYLKGPDTEVARKIAELALPPEKQHILVEIIDGALTDAFYSILLGLDGAASIGGRQVDYQLRDEEGAVLTDGEIEAHAWEAFQTHGKHRPPSANS